MRLVFAGAGTWIFVGVLLIGSVSAAAPGLHRTAAAASNFLSSSALICFFIAFSTPRMLATRWQRAEQARYLSETAERDAEARGEHAAADSARAAERSVGHSAIMVALGAGSPTDSLVVRSSNVHAFLGEFIEHDAATTLGHAMTSGVAATRPLAGAHSALIKRLQPLGESLLVAPIVSTEHTWGLVLVVQRRGSLFPDDDLRLLAQLARYAATALDHAQLIADEKDRERRAADRRLREIESRWS